MKDKDVDLEKMVDGTDILFYIADLEGHIIFISNAGANLLGSQKESLIGQDIFGFFKPEIAEKRRSAISAIIQTKAPLSFFDEREGHYFKTTAYPVFDKNGELKQIAAYVQDLTEIKKAEEETIRLKTELERTIKGSPAHVFRFRKNSQGNIVAVLSEGLVADKFGITTKRIKDKSLLEMFGQDLFNKIGPYYEKAFRGEHVSFEVYLQDTWFQTAIAPYEKDPNGNIPEVVGYSMDITLVKKAQEELEKAEKLESLGVLAGGIAHDFNNLLGGLFGYIDLARVSLTSDNPAMEYVDSAMQCFARAKDLTQQLLTFSKGGAPLKKTIALGPLILESIRLALSGSSIRCEKNLQRGLYSIHADHGQINQVFNNVLLNARQAMPNGGIIRIDARNKEVNENEFPCITKGPYVHIRFADQGTGIPKEILPRVFDPFYTTKQAGSGLGLATSYSIIRKHEGHIYLESELGKGTTVNILLPAATDFSPTEDKPGDLIYAGKCRILLMDDEEVMRNVAFEMIGRAGCEIICVESGEKAIEKYSASMIAGRKFDIVILDLTVMTGMGGEMAVRRLLEIDPNVKAIVSSGYSDSPVLAKPAEYGFSGKIAKPYQLNDLLRVISDVLNKKQK